MNKVKFQFDAMILEYQCLSQEISQRARAYLNLASTAWLIAIVHSIGLLKTLEETPTLLEKPSFKVVLILIPIALSVLTATFIRNELKTLTAIQYLYIYLRPEVTSLIHNCDNQEIKVDIWKWPNREFFLAKKAPKIIRYTVELCRYLIILFPVIITYIIAGILLKIDMQYLKEMSPNSHVYWIAFFCYLSFWFLIVSTVYTIWQFLEFHKMFDETSSVTH